MTNKRRLVSLVAVTVMVVFAGCSGVPVGGDQSTPDQVTLTEEDYPPGVTEDGISDASAFTRNNAEVLQEDGYLSQLRIDASVDQQNQTQNISLIQNEAVSAGASELFFQAEQAQGTDQSRTTVWSNQTLTLARNEDSRQTLYQRIDREQITSQLAGQQVLAQYIGAGTGAYNVTETTRENETKQVELLATDYTTRTSQQMPNPENVTEYRSEVTFDNEGRIHSVELRMVAVRSDRGTIEFNVRFELIDTGSSIQVEKPPWIGDALEQTANGTSAPTQRA